MVRDIFNKVRNIFKRFNGLSITIAIIFIFTISFIITFKVIEATVYKDNNGNEVSNTINNENEGKLLLEEKPQPKPDELVKGSNVTYDGDKYAIDASEVKKMLDGQYEGDEKYVFLTFDDGPTDLTSKILDILNEKDVKATFFILGSRLEEDQGKEMLKRELLEGHAIANHSYTHSLKKLYPQNKLDIDYFMEEFNKTNDTMRAVLGDDFNTKVLRMPGGYNSRQYYKDPNLLAFDERLDRENIVSIDWNALNGDAEGKPYTEEKMLQYVKDSSAGKSKVIILMHDSYGKDKTINILPQVIDYFKEQSFEFKTIK